MSVCYSIPGPWLDRCQGSIWDGLNPLGHKAPMKFTLGDARGRLTKIDEPPGPHCSKTHRDPEDLKQGVVSNLNSMSANHEGQGGLDS